jgi:hypothetical protein
MFLVSTNVFALSDMKDSKDFPAVPRITGIKIVAYAYSDFDEGQFSTGGKKKDIEKYDYQENVPALCTWLRKISPGYKL